MREKRPIHDLFELIKNIDFKEYSSKTPEIEEIVSRYDEYFKKYDYHETFYDRWSYSNSSFEFQDCNYRNQTEPELSKILLEVKNSEDLSDYAKLVLFNLDFIFRHSDEYYKHQTESKGVVKADKSLNMYLNPEIILGHTFEKMKLEEIAKTDVSQFCSDIKLFYEKCSKILARSIVPTTDNFRRDDGKISIDLFDSLDLFLALSFIYWIMIFDSINARNYLEALNKFLKEFLNDYPTPRNINPYLKGKFGIVLETEMVGTYLAYPKEYDQRIKDITEKKSKTQISDLLTLLNETKDNTLRIEIISKLASLESSFLDKNMNLIDPKLELLFLSLILNEEMRVVHYAKHILKKTQVFCEESQRKIIEMLKIAKPSIQEIILEITENKQIEFEGEEEEIVHLVTNKQFDNLSKFNNSDFLMKLLKDEYEKYEKENQQKLQEDRYVRVDHEGHITIIESFRNFEHQESVSFLLEIIKDDKPYLKKTAFEVLGDINTEESNELLLDIFRQGIKEDTSEFGAMLDYRSKTYRANDSQILAVLSLAYSNNETARKEFLDILKKPEKVSNFEARSKNELLKRFYESGSLKSLFLDERSGTYFNALILGLLSYQKDECIEGVIKFLPNAEEKDRAAILKNLIGKIEEDRLIDLLKQNLAKDKSNYTIRRTCLKILATLNSTKAIKYILKLLEDSTEKKELLDYLSKSENKSNIVRNEKLVSKLLEQLYEVIDSGKIQKDQVRYYRSIIKILSEANVLEDKITAAFMNYMRIGESECCEIPELVDYLSKKPRLLDQIMKGITDNHKCIRCTSMEILAHMAGIALENSEIDTILKIQTLIPELEQQMRSQPSSIEEHERMWLRYQATLALSALGAESAVVEEGVNYINRNIHRYRSDGKSRVRKKLEAIEKYQKNYTKLAEEIAKRKGKTSKTFNEKKSDTEPSKKKSSSSKSKKSKNLSKNKLYAIFTKFEKQFNNEKSSIKKELIVSEFFKDLEEHENPQKYKEEILKLMDQNPEFRKIVEKLFDYRSMEERFG